MKTAIVWFRRDLRITDNTALAIAAARAANVIPVIDAAMRQLNQMGYMPNRARIIVAMFLTKDLLLDWRLGESFFMQKLTDGEIASNNGGWQWSAGTGADAAPYFRILNPWTQTSRHDAAGEYIKEWIPELRDIQPEKFAHPPPQVSAWLGIIPRPSSTMQELVSKPSSFSTGVDLPIARFAVRAGLREQGTLSFFLCLLKEKPSCAPASVSITGKVYLRGTVPSVEKRENQIRFHESGVRDTRISQPSKHHTAAERR